MCKLYWLKRAQKKQYLWIFFEVVLQNLQQIYHCAMQESHCRRSIAAWFWLKCLQWTCYPRFPIQKNHKKMSFSKCISLSFQICRSGEIQSKIFNFLVPFTFCDHFQLILRAMLSFLGKKSRISDTIVKFFNMVFWIVYLYSL